MSAASAIGRDRFKVGTPIDGCPDPRFERRVPSVRTVADFAVANQFVEQRARRPEGNTVDPIVGRTLVDYEEPRVGGTEGVEIERPITIDVHDECRGGHERTSQCGIRETVIWRPKPNQRRQACRWTGMPA